MSERVRLTEKQRKAVIVKAGVEVAKEYGLAMTTYESVSEKCSVTTSLGTVRSYFRTKTHLWRAIALHDDATDDIRELARTMGIIK